MLNYLILVFFTYRHYFFTNTQAPQSPLESSSHKVLKTTNVSDIEADALFLMRDYARAIEKYKEALGNATSLSEELRIEYQIAGATLNLGDRVKAARLFKDIVDNPKYTDDDLLVKKGKAAAMGMLIRTFYQTSEKAVSDIMFSGKPFEDFAKVGRGNIDDAILRFEEYIFSYSPSPEILIAARIADLYAIKVYNFKTRGNLNEDEREKVEEYENIVKEKIAFVDAHYDNAENYYQYSKQQSLPIVLGIKGAAVGSLTAVGDTSLGDPEDIFKQALTLHQPPWTRTMIRLNYAVFLAAAYGQRRADDIDSLLQDFYSMSTDSEDTLETLLVHERDNPTHKTQAFHIIAAASQKFHALLFKFGWKF